MDLEKEVKKKKTFKEVIVSIPSFLKESVRQIVFLTKFFTLLFFVVIKYVLNRSPRRKLDKPAKRKVFGFDFLRKRYESLYRLVLNVFDKTEPSEVKNSDLIFLAMKNLSTKKNRTYVTIGGMAIGFGAVILLLSTGYGFERLVVSQVASLSEMKQIDVNISKGSPLVFNEEAITSITSIPKVEAVIPIVTSVSKITYNNAVSDVIVYGVSSRYFEETGMSPILGKVFSDETENIKGSNEEEGRGEVAGTSSILINKKDIGEEVYKIKYTINPTVWKAVYSKADSNSKVLGYTKREAGKQEATEVWGSKYKGSEERNAIDIEGKEYSVWVKDGFALWEKKECFETNPDCVDNEYIVIRITDGQNIQEGYITEEDLVIERYELSKGSSFEVYSGKVIESVDFGIKDTDYTNLYLDTSEDSVVVNILGDKLSTGYKGSLLYGDSYGTNGEFNIKSSNGKEYGYWIKTDLELWSSEECDTVCDEYTTSKQGELDRSTTVSGYFKVSELLISEEINEIIYGKVLGDQDNASFIDLEELKESDDTIDWATISSELGGVEEVDKDIKEIPDSAQRVSLVNTAMLNLLGISEDDAVGEKFGATIIFDSKLFNRSNYIVESEAFDIEIVGVVYESNSPIFYLPLQDILVDGMENVSSIKVIVKDTGDVAGVRESIESSGFQTSSVVDTVDSINELFGTLRIALLVLGLIALGVASLGMFNTLTVSLLEKTREVGLLKTMGLKSSEVKILFLAESLVMSVMGGLAGLLLGFVVGKLFSILISVLAIAQGRAALDVTYIPFLLGFGLVFISALVGILTGWYPAERAKKISALNALRYE